MRVAKRISNGRIVTGQNGVSDEVILANIATTPIPTSDIVMVDMEDAEFQVALAEQ